MCTPHGPTACLLPLHRLDASDDASRPLQFMTTAWWMARTRRKRCEAERDRSADTLTDAAIDAAILVRLLLCAPGHGERAASCSLVSGRSDRSMPLDILWS